jgi:hypothetical protein
MNALAAQNQKYRICAEQISKQSRSIVEFVTHDCLRTHARILRRS